MSDPARVSSDRSGMPLDNLCADDLIPIVAQVIKRSDTNAVDWQMAPLGGVGGSRYAGGLGLTRLSGTAASAGETIPWSLIVKGFDGSDDTVEPDNSSRSPSSWSYWKREILAYESDILADLTGSLVAPLCYAVTEHPENRWLLWMEEVQDSITDWTMAEHGLTARHIGQFNGSYLADRKLPVEQHWFCRGRVRDPQWMTVAAERFEDFQRYADSETGRRWISQESIARMQRLYDSRDAMTQMLNRVPTTLCHHDAFCRNLMVRNTGLSEPQTVAIDWSMLGYGVLGEDPAISTANALYFLDVEADRAAELDQTIFAAYVDGLRDAGWEGDVRLARYGYTAAAALVVGVAITTFLGTLHMTEDAIPRVEALFGHSIDEMWAQWAVAHPFLLDLGDEALQLMEELS